MNLGAEWVSAMMTGLGLFGSLFFFVYRILRGQTERIEAIREALQKMIAEDRKAVQDMIRDNHMMVMNTIAEDRRATAAALEKLNDRVTANMATVQASFVTNATMDSLRADIREQFGALRSDIRTYLKIKEDAA